MIDAGGVKGERRRHRGKLMKKYALGLINPPKPSVGNLTSDL
jgi:hypothetical protein